MNAVTFTATVTQALQSCFLSIQLDLLVFLLIFLFSWLTDLKTKSIQANTRIVVFMLLCHLPICRVSVGEGTEDDRKTEKSSEISKDLTEYVCKCMCGICMYVLFVFT